MKGLEKMNRNLKIIFNIALVVVFVYGAFTSHYHWCYISYLMMIEMDLIDIKEKFDILQILGRKEEYK